METYLINFGSTTKDTVSLKHVKPFGCKLFYHSKGQSKLDERGVLGFFLLFDVTRQSTLVYNPELRKAIHVDTVGKFFTNVFYKDWLKQKNGGQVEEEDELQIIYESDEEKDIILPSDNSESSAVPSVPDRMIVDENQQTAERTNVPQSQQHHDEKEMKVPLELVEKEFLPRRSKRIRNLPAVDYRVSVVHFRDQPYMHDVLVNRLPTDPNSFEECIDRTDSHHWWKAMEEEFNSLIENETWEYCELPPGKKVIQTRWVYNSKLDEFGQLERHKARFTAKGFSQRFGIEFNTTFAPVLKYETGKFIMLYSKFLGYEVYQIDIKTAFLYSKIDEKIYITQAKGFELPGREHLVCKLKKCLYGLKQSSRCWNRELGKTLKELGFRKLKSEPSVYIRNPPGVKPIFITVTVDDLLICALTKEIVDELIKNLSKKYKVKNLGIVNWYLGLQIIFDEERKLLIFNHGQYIEHILKRFDVSHLPIASTPVDHNIKYVKKECCTAETRHNCSECKHEYDEVNAYPYMEILGSLIHLGVVSRPDLSQAISLFSKFSNNPSLEHCDGLTRVLQYLRGTVNLCLHYDYSTFTMDIFSDANWRKYGDWRSFGGLAVMVGGAPIFWKSFCQKRPSDSSCVSEYYSAIVAAKKACFFRNLLDELNIVKDPVIPVHIDNESTIKIASDDIISAKTEHIGYRYHFIRDMVERKEISLHHVESKLNVADIFTKALPPNDFRRAVEMLNMRRI